MQKNSMLKIVSIILIVLSVFTLISALTFSTVSAFVIDMFTEMINSGEFDLEGQDPAEFFELLGNILTAVSIGMYVSVVIMIVAGVVGIMQNNVTLCWVFGALSIFCSLILGILYLVGTKKLQDERADYIEKQQNERYV